MPLSVAVTNSALDFFWSLFKPTPVIPPDRRKRQQQVKDESDALIQTLKMTEIKMTTDKKNGPASSQR